MNGKRALVTGGNGFIGAVLTRRLEQEGVAVTILSRHARRPDDLAANAGSRDALRQALDGRAFDAVFHLAGAGVNPEKDKGVSLLHANAEGTENLLTVLESIPTCPVVVAGSWTEYGPSETGVMRETDACFPSSPYGISKLASTLIACAWAKRLDRPLTVLRFFNVWGPGEPPHRLGPSLVRAFAAGERPHVSNPDLRRDFVHVDDAVEALVRISALELHGEIINVGTGNALPLREFAERVRQAFGTDLQPEWNAAALRPWDVPAAQASIEKLQSLLDWTPKIKLDEKMSEAVQAYRSIV